MTLAYLLPKFDAGRPPTLRNRLFKTAPPVNKAVNYQRLSRALLDFVELNWTELIYLVKITQDVQGKMKCH